MTAKKDAKPVSEKALRARINRKLAHDHEALRRCRTTSRDWATLGNWYIVDVYRNAITDKHVDLETCAKDLGVLGEDEVLAGEKDGL